ncbi:hypothetical protein ACJ2_19920 [Pantoea sp. QMID2]|nr:hypothetical protein ACJ3_13320 [Pantoea sp. QMID3]GME34626.1 hypothetical protein ACJ1_13240 [Pantoea sp. QMID1]GME55557.1 hypothetical protein ACJ4_19900 [Pantoea sp. QMID4]GME56604.1 hypothetical protein ACJ2_19920 [Pantoea sp. QMID2]
MARKETGKIPVAEPCDDIAKSVDLPVSVRTDMLGIPADHGHVRLPDNGSIPEKRIFHDNPSVYFFGQDYSPGPSG